MDLSGSQFVVRAEAYCSVQWHHSLCKVEMCRAVSIRDLPRDLCSHSFMFSFCFHIHCHPYLDTKQSVSNHFLSSNSSDIYSLSQWDELLHWNQMVCLGNLCRHVNVGLTCIRVCFVLCVWCFMMTLNLLSCLGHCHSLGVMWTLTGFYQRVTKRVAIQWLPSPTLWPAAWCCCRTKIGLQGQHS